MVAFDTLKASQRLRKAGFAEDQANALVAAFAEDIGANLATKDDIALLRKDLEMLRQSVQQDIDALRQEMTSENAALRQEMASEIAALRKEMASENAAIRKDIDTLRQEMASENAAIRKEMASENAAIRKDIGALRKDIAREMALQEERITARMERMTTRLTLTAMGLAGLVLTAIGVVAGILATL